MTGYDLDRLQRELSELDVARHTTDKGNNLHRLTGYLLGQVPGVTILGEKVHDRARSDEKDLWIRHAYWGGLPFTDRFVVVECKNEKRSTSASEIRDLAAKVRQAGGGDVLLVTRAGLSGSPENCAHDAIHLELASGTRITVITGADLAKLEDTDDLVDLMNDRFFELRSYKTYVTI